MPADPEQRALARMIKESARIADELAELRKPAVALPRSIRVQLNNAIEETDLLIHLLHERTLLRVVATADDLARQADA